MKTPAPQRAAGRKKLAKANDALPDGSFPIPDVAYLKKAIRAVGRAPASKRPALKALIRKRAKALGAMNEPGVKGTWAFANDDSKALEMATMTRMPKVRGAADVTVSRSGPGTVTVMHKSTGMKVGTLSKGVAGWQGTHSTGAKTEPSPSMAGSLSGLIGMHNKMAKSMPSSEPMAKSYANGEQAMLSFATSAATSSDGPRVTSMGAGKKARAMPAVKLSAPANIAPEVQKVYAELIKKGLKPAQAMGLAKRAAAMHAKKTAKAA